MHWRSARHHVWYCEINRVPGAPLSWAYLGNVMHIGSLDELEHTETAEQSSVLCVYQLSVCRSIDSTGSCRCLWAVRLRAEGWHGWKLVFI